MAYPAAARAPLRSLDRESMVLSKAVANAADRLGLNNTELAKILGVSQSTISRLRHHEYSLNQSTKEFELGALLVRLYRGLSGILGGDDASACSWLRNHNTALSGVPSVLIQSAQGLTRVVMYVDARRASI